MERLALISIVFLSGLWAINGAMATAAVAARKGYNPRLGALVGALTGAGGSLIAGLGLRLVWPSQAGIAVVVSLIAGRVALALLWRTVPARDDVPPTDLPVGEALRRSIVARHVRGSIARTLFISAVIIALLALATLLATIVNKAFGLTAVQYAVEPAALTLTAYDPGAGLGEVDPTQIPVVLAQNIRVVRLQELILERLAEADPAEWDAMKSAPLADVLEGQTVPEALARLPVGTLTAEQAAELLAGALDPETLQELVYTEAGRPITVLSNAELAAVLAESFSAEDLRDLVLTHGAGQEADDLTSEQAAAILLQNLPRETVEDIVVFDADQRALEDLPRRALGSLLANTLNKNRMRKLIAIEIVGASESDLPALSSMPIGELLQGKSYSVALAEVSFSKLNAAQAADLLGRNLSRDAIEDLLADEVTLEQVVKGWPLLQSLTDREEIKTYVEANLPRAHLRWFSWVNSDFLSNSINYSQPDATGVRPALIGSLLVILITIAIAFPIGVGAAIYLEEYAGRTRLNHLIQTNINNLAGVPSIIYGMLGLAIFVRMLGDVTSGSVFGVANTNGRTVFSASLTLALLILPVIIINAQEAIRAVPSSLRQASYGLGATQWQTIWNHVLPYAMPGILTGTILAISRAIGETAPLILVGGATFLTRDPDGPFSQFTALPLVIYRLTTLPRDEFRNAAAAAIIVLLLLLLTLNAVAVILRNRFSRRLT